jgi:hypothetical protein
MRLLCCLCVLCVSTFHFFFSMQYVYRVFREQADCTLTHTNHKDTKQSTIEDSVTFDGVTLTYSLIR